MPDQNILIVPSAIVVPDELRLDVGSVPTGMIPLRGKPMLEWIAEKYQDLNVEMIVSVHEEARAVKQYISNSQFDWTAVDIQSTTGLGETVEATLNNIKAERLENSGLYLNFADTLVSPIPDLNSGNYVSRKSVNRTYRWTTFRSSEGQIEQIVPKYERSSKKANQTFVGQFGITEPLGFCDALEKAQQQQLESESAFYSALENYLSGRSYTLNTPKTWIDVGHLDTYHQAKRDFLNTREFNELHVNAKNVITKRSDDTSTLVNEIEWYRKIPNELQPYLPRIYDSSTDPVDPYLKMEYIGYPSLSDIQLYGSHGKHIWNNIFYRLFNVLSEFREFSPDASRKRIRLDLEKMYISKTQNRLARLQSQDGFSEFFRKENVRVNGKYVPGINKLLDELETTIESGGLLNCDEFSIIHGDLCLPNVLYDPRNQIVKLIDPRGAFGDFNIYGDPRYDLAKLRHSFVGHYEHLINGRFTASVTESEDAHIKYDVETTQAQERRESQFDQALIDQYNTCLSEVKLIEALLYLSMVPLHSDSYERQLCMLGKGLTKIAPHLTE